MATNITTTRPNLMPISKVFQDAPVEDLGEGIRSALGQLSIMGNIFSIRYRGNIEQLPPAHARQIEMIILKSAKTQGKAYFPGGFTGDNKPPVCWSSNSIVPDAAVPPDQVQNKSCGTCPNNVFVTSANGLKNKPCGDHKRLAITPVDDPMNEAYGGAMIFRVPAGSLGALEKYGNELKKYGVPFYAYTTVVTLMLVNNVTKLTFESGRPLNDDEASIVKELREDEKSGRIVNEMLAEYDEESITTGTANTAETPPKAAGVVPPKPTAPKPATQATQTTQAAQGGLGQGQSKAGLNPGQQSSAAPSPTVKPVQVANTITGAVAQPATPPASQRVVVTEVEEVTEVIEEYGEGQLPDEMDTMFGDLIKRT